MKLLKTRIPLFPIWPEFVALDGIRVPIKQSPLDPRTRRRLIRGLYEPSERDLISQFIQPGDRILELGASVGIVSCFLARQAGPAGRLVSVEADIRLREPFQTQMALNGLSATWINALACPLWRDEVPAPIASQSFAQSDRTLSGRAAAATSVTQGPPWMTAGAICKQQHLAPTALVVDIEGSEAAWADYPLDFPESLRIVIAEFHPHITGSQLAGRAVQAILDEGFVVAGIHLGVVALKRVRQRSEPPQNQSPTSANTSTSHGA